MSSSDLLNPGYYLSQDPEDFACLILSKEEKTMAWRSGPSLQFQHQEAEDPELEAA